MNMRVPDQDAHTDGSRTRLGTHQREGVFLVLLLLTMAMGGCLAEDETPRAMVSDGAENRPTLPDRLEMDGANIVSHDETTVTWKWRGSVGPGVATRRGGDPVGPTATSRFDLPPTAAAVQGTLSWTGVPGTTLALTVLDASRNAICKEALTAVSGAATLTCTGLTGPADGAARGSVRVEPYVAAHPVAFELELLLTLGRGTPFPERQPTADAAALPNDDPHTVIGFGDTGINPYHTAYRDRTATAYQHPSTYIDGYPEDAVALDLTLDAPTYLDAIATDAALWDSVEKGILYWIPGTKIIGAYAPDVPRSYEQSFCRPVLDCDGHGSGMAARAIAEGYGLCPECKLVEVQGYQTGIEWMAERSWIDIQILEYCAYPVREDHLGDRAEDDAMLSTKPMFFTGGNGLGNTFGVGVPYYPCHHEGLPNAITVGGHDDGRLTTWSNPLPHVVADACSVYPRHDSLDGDRFGCGESLAAPYAAGAGGAIIQEARRILGDHAGGIEDRVLARGPTDRVDEGPLADGELTLDEFRRVLFSTADPRPGPDEHGGPACTSAICMAIGTTPIEWQTIPADVPQYYFIGYGGITPDTLEHAKRVLRGEAQMPERPMEDAFFVLDQEVRKSLVEVDP